MRASFTADFTSFFFECALMHVNASEDSWILTGSFPYRKLLYVDSVVVESPHLRGEQIQLSLATLYYQRLDKLKTDTKCVIQLLSRRKSAVKTRVVQSARNAGGKKMSLQQTIMLKMYLL